MIMITLQKQEQQQREKEELNYFENIYHLAELSVYKLNPPLRPRTEPTLRRQLLVRNLLEMSAHLIINQPKQEEELWLDACFDQLDDFDETMEEEEDYQQEQQDQKEEKIILMIPLCKNQNKPFFQCNL